MTDINLKTLTPDTSLPQDGFLFGADSQATASPSVYSTQAVATTLLGSTSLTGGPALTGSSAPVLNLSQTWNSVGTTFTGMKFNVVSDTSAAASLLMDLQVGGTSQLRVRKDGFLLVASSIGMGDGVNSGSNAGAFTISGANNAYINIGGVGNFRFVGASGYDSMSIIYGGGPQVASTGYFGFTSSSNTQGTLDTIITRKGIANLQLGAADAAAPAAQTLSVQSVVAGQTNASAAAYPFTITGAQGTGTGAGGSIIFQVAPAGGAGTAQNALSAALTIAPVGTGSFLTVPQCATNIVAIGITSGNGISIRSGGVIDIISGGGGIATFTNAIATGSQFNVGICFSNGSTTAAGPDVFVLRDAVNTLAQRNGTAAQALNIYNTYTSSTSFERYSVDWITTANLAIVGPNKGSGGGTQRVQRLSYLEDGGAGSTVPLLGSTCPAASGTVKSWIKIITSDGTTAYIPCWA